MFLTNKTTVIAKLEASPYDGSGETLATGDFNVRVRNDVSYSPEVDEYRRKYLESTLDHDLSVPGRQRGTVSFVVDMAPAAAVDTVPAWGKLLEACGFKETVYATFGVGWVPHTENTHTPITLEVHERLEGAAGAFLVTRFISAMGNVTFSIGTVGEPVQMNFEFTGAFESMTDLADPGIVPGTLSTIKPGAVLGATVTVGGIAQDLDTFEFNMNNSISEWIDPAYSTGIAGYYKDSFEPQLTVDPTLKQLSAEPVYTEWLACTPGAVSVVVANGADPDITLSAPAAQRVAVGIGDRNGARTAETTFLLTKGAVAGNDVFEVLQGAKA